MEGGRGQEGGLERAGGSDLTVPGALRLAELLSGRPSRRCLFLGM